MQKRAEDAQEKDCAQKSEYLHMDSGVRRCKLIVQLFRHWLAVCKSISPCIIIAASECKIKASLSNPCWASAIVEEMLSRLFATWQSMRKFSNLHLNHAETILLARLLIFNGFNRIVSTSYDSIESQKGFFSFIFK